MQDAQTIARIKRKYKSLLPELDERRRRQWAAAEARELGWGGVSLVARATGLSRPTITAGDPESLPGAIELLPVVGNDGALPAPGGDTRVYQARGAVRHAHRYRIWL